MMIKETDNINVNYASINCSAYYTSLNFAFGKATAKVAHESLGDWDSWKLIYNNFDDNAFFDEKTVEKSWKMVEDTFEKIINKNSWNFDKKLLLSTESDILKDIADCKEIFAFTSDIRFIAQYGTDKEKKETYGFIMKQKPRLEKIKEYWNKVLEIVKNEILKTN